MNVTKPWYSDEAKRKLAIELLPDYTFTQVGEAVGVTRSSIAGFVWRARKKGVEIKTRPNPGHADYPVAKKRIEREMTKKKDNPQHSSKNKVFGIARVATHKLRPPTHPEKLAAKASLTIQSPSPRTVLAARAIHCRYPITGLGADTMFCGNTIAHAHTSYCAEHGTVVYTPVRTRSHRATRR